MSSLRASERDSSRFNHTRRDVFVHAGRSLHELQEVRLIRRDMVSIDPPMTEFVLTDRGRALRESLRSLFREADPYG
jgi:DNA-binding HxlR family transcriptional regulator